MNYLDVTAGISLVLTSPTLYVCAAVAVAWWGKARQMWLDNRTATTWFAFGVLIGFIASFFDNVYWGLAWAAKYALGDGEVTDWLFNHGSLFNIGFRQAGIIMAGYAHIKSKSLFDGTSMDSFHNRLLMSIVVGLAVVWGLTP